MGRSYLLRNGRLVEKRAEQVRTPVVFFCLGIVLIMVAIIVTPMFKKDSTPVLQDATPTNVRSHGAKMALMAGNSTNEISGTTNDKVSVEYHARPSIKD